MSYRLLIAFLILGAGCGQTEPPVSINAPGATDRPVGSRQVVEMDASAYISTPHSFSGEDFDAEERRYIAEQSVQSLGEIYGAISLSASWREADSRVRDLLASISEAPDYIRQQHAGIYMLRYMFSGSEISPDALSVVSYYTEFLVEHRTPEAALLVQALNALDGYWSPEKIVVSAKRGLEGVETFLAKRYYCDGCPTKAVGLRALQNEQVKASEDVFLIQVEQARDQLKAMSAL